MSWQFPITPRFAQAGVAASDEDQPIGQIGVVFEG